MGQQDVSLIQSVNCVRIYLSPLIALVELLFPIFILSNHTKALAWVRQRKLLACLPTTLCTAYQLKVQLFFGGGVMPQILDLTKNRNRTLMDQFFVLENLFLRETWSQIRFKRETKTRYKNDDAADAFLNLFYREPLSNAKMDASREKDFVQTTPDCSSLGLFHRPMRSNLGETFI